jgi:PAS domain S-box-containing protein
MKDSLKMLELNKDVNGALFLKIFDGMNGVFNYYKLIVDKKEKPENYRFLLVNNAIEKHSNSNTEANIGKTIKEIFPDIEESWIDNLRTAILGTSPTQFTDFNVNTKRYFHVNSFLEEKNKFVMIIDDVTKERNSIEELSFQNIEKEKRVAELVIANKELAFQNNEKNKRVEELVITKKELDGYRYEKERLAHELTLLIDTANAPIFGINAAGKVNEWNQKSAEITGFKKTEVLGKDIVETYITEDYRDAVKLVLDNALKGKETANYEFPLFTKDGKRVMVLLNSSTRRDADGKIVGVLGVGQDISEMDKLRTVSEAVAKELRQFI